MKQAAVVLAFIGFITSSFSGCEKFGSDMSAPFKAKLVASFCAFYIVQIEDPAFYRLGTDWTSSSGQQYEKVFTVINHCDFPARIKVGESFRCRIVERASNNQCIVCLGFMETPSKGQIIKVE